MHSEPGGLGTKPSSLAYLLNDLEQVTYPQWVPVSHLPKEVIVLFTPGLLDGLNEILYVKWLARSGHTHTQKSGMMITVQAHGQGWVLLSPWGPPPHFLLRRAGLWGSYPALVTDLCPSWKRDPRFLMVPKKNPALCESRGDCHILCPGERTICYQFSFSFSFF